MYSSRPDATDAIKSAQSLQDLLSVSGTWEYSTANSQWKPMPGIVDSTLALSRTGWVQFKAPSDAVPGRLLPLYELRLIPRGPS